VPGEGPSRAYLLFLAEAPGATEDEHGRPLIGKAGRIFRNSAEQAGIDLDKCYIGNICRCKPPENRTPNPDEVEACWPWVLKTLQLIKPRIIVPLGDTALRTLAYKFGFQKFLRKDKITNLAGKPFYVEDRKFYVFPMVHPSYAARRRDVREAFRAHFVYLKEAIPGWLIRT
jgi:DNA polymerase